MAPTQSSPATLYIPNAQLGALLSTLAATLKLSGLGGKLNGKLVTIKRVLVVAAEDFDAASTLLRDEFTKWTEVDGKRVKVPVVMRDESGAVVYKRNERGDLEYEPGTTQPVPVFDPRSIALTDPQAYLDELNELLAVDAVVELSCGLLDEPELLVIASKGPGELRDGLEDLGAASRWLKPKHARESAARARRDRMWARHKAPSPLLVLSNAGDAESPDRDSDSDSDLPALSASELDGTLSADETGEAAPDAATHA